VINVCELDFILQMKQPFDEAMNLTNETDEEAQRNEREMKDKDNVTEEDESDPEDESHRIFQELLDGQFRRGLSDNS
jgi:hypothetical protein